MTNHRTPVARGWLAGSPADIRWARWGGDSVAYHCPSGKTHLLNAASELLITRILSEVKTTSEIVEDLASLQSRPVDSTYTESIVKLMERLEQLGLIDRV